MIEFIVLCLVATTALILLAKFIGREPEKKTVPLDLCFHGSNHDEELIKK
jgi:hypothetical protein